MAKKIHILCILLFVQIVISAGPAMALKKMSDQELSQVTAEAGISVIVDNLALDWAFGTIAWEDPDGFPAYAGTGDKAYFRLLGISTFSQTGSVPQDHDITLQFNDPMDIDMATAAANIDIDSDGTTDIPNTRPFMRFIMPEFTLTLPPLPEVNFEWSTAAAGTGTYQERIFNLDLGRLEFGVYTDGGLLYLYPHYLANNQVGWSLGFDDVPLFLNLHWVQLEDSAGTVGYMRFGEKSGAAATSADRLSAQFNVSGVLHFDVFSATLPTHNELRYNGTSMVWTSIAASTKTMISILTPGLTGINLTSGMEYNTHDVGYFEFRNVRLQGANDDARLYISGENNIQAAITAQLFADHYAHHWASGAQDWVGFNHFYMAGAVGAAAGYTYADENPASWSVSGNFRLGNMGDTTAHRPVTLDTGVYGSSVFSILNLIGNGVIMAENVRCGSINMPHSGPNIPSNQAASLFGGDPSPTQATNGFGPVVIRGLDVYYTGLKIPGNGFVTGP